MTGTSRSPFELGPTGSPLTAAAAVVLRAAGYDTGPVDLEDGSALLLAENALVVIGVLEFHHVADLPSVEAAASLRLADLIADAGSKRWDTYLVLLTSAAANERGMSEGVTDILYNTRYLRRVLRWGVAPTEDALTSALRPFLPLSRPSEHGLVDPMESLALRLTERGLDETTVATALAQWHADGVRDDE